MMNPLQRINNVATRHLPLKLIRSHLKAPVASITFDDFPRSAWIDGRLVLQRHDARATYYASGRFCGRFEDGCDYYTADDLRQMHDAGHEIGCHTFSHQRGTEVDSASLDEDARRNQAFVNEVLGDYRLTSFAYPYGDVSPRTKLVFSRRFATSRGIRSGVNAGLIDLAQLKAVGVERRSWAPNAIEAAVAEAVRRSGWLILFTHDVGDNPTPFGATPEMVDHALGCLRDHDIDILPIKHALARVAFG